MTGLMIAAIFETIFMVFMSFFVGVIIGIPLAIFLFNNSNHGLRKCIFVYNILEFLINAIRSIPYIILILLLIPVSRFLVGSSIGIYAAIIPLSISSILLITKVVEEALYNLRKGLIDVGLAMGATNAQIIWKILIPEALPNIVSGLTLIIINLVGFSAMAGVVGGGGLGDLAIRYGYQRYNLEILGIIVVILIVLVHLLQSIGNIITKATRK